MRSQCLSLIFALAESQELRQEPADLGELRDLLGMASAPESRPESQLINLSKDKAGKEDFVIILFHCSLKLIQNYSYYLIYLIN